ncbi:V-type proton ATPase proteolipid subunit [Mycena sanguinolenta]|uniref:V-type proton ATPase proteolipid subunit n=1 Tax=Mycena sanguinolenta TaxID=230812 RepID=A0A8H6ZF34_9AGAR|nr:V-type proton ATPase proteolipid subunit [Mycena sanguinolenta]
MNRLPTLEANHTLYARYVEEHTGAVRDAGEDLEGVGDAQAQTHVERMRKQRKRVDAEYYKLMRHIEYLFDEVRRRRFLVESNFAAARLCSGSVSRDSVAAAPRSAPGPAAGISAPDMGSGSDVFALPSPMPSGAQSADRAWRWATLRELVGESYV